MREGCDFGRKERGGEGVLAKGAGRERENYNLTNEGWGVSGIARMRVMCEDTNHICTSGKYVHT